MSDKPEGWYTDPAPPQPGIPTTMRWWDGSGWTGRTRGATRAEMRAHREHAEIEHARASAAHREQVQAHVARHGVLPPRPPVPQSFPEAPPERSFTPDGQALSGWWMRVAASILDWLVTTTVGTLLAWPFLRQIIDGMSGYATAASTAARNGQPGPDVGAFVTAAGGPFLAVVAILFGVGLAYEIGFLKAMNATPGKLVLGLEVRLRERPGRLRWGTVLIRVFGQRLGSVIGLAPFGGVIGSIYALLDVLWPLWDGRRQAVHDKMAGTSVVRRL